MALDPEYIRDLHPLDLDPVEIAEELHRLRDRLGAIEIRTATGEGLSPEECMTVHLMANVREDWERPSVSTPPATH